eukprot:364951-Chlamydomonas_euryale.AAC.1
MTAPARRRRCRQLRSRAASPTTPASLRRWRQLQARSPPSAQRRAARSRDRRRAPATRAPALTAPRRVGRASRDHRPTTQTARAAGGAAVWGGSWGICVGMILG